MTSSCETCNDLWQLLTEPEAVKKKINLGSFDEALSSKCPDHTRIIEEFKKTCDDSEFSPKKPTRDLGFMRDDSSSSTALYRSLEHLGRVWNFVAVKKEEVENHPGIGRVLDPSWVDLKRINEWKQDCLTQHGAKCDNPLKIPSASPAWLVDVEKMCIVSGGEGKTYVALSYRSSNLSTFQLQSTNIEDLQKDGALIGSETWSELPAKVQDAISLTASLGERYLWTDVLCIDHSNRVATTEQLNLMTAIYAGALVSIIAADGDRSSGINGLKGASKPREMNQELFSIGNERVLVRNTGIFDLDNFHEYHKRGWTYQEFKMSPRKLLFMRGEAHWECSCSVWHEELTLGTELDKYLDPRPHVLSAGFPDLGSLGHMLQTYNSRELTYDEDALAAITGLLTVFSRTFKGGFIYGLPEMLFESALAWRPLWSHTDLRRREASGKPSHIGFTATDLPSWSWVGWQGLFSLRYGEAVRVNDRQYWIEETTPITEWYTSSAPSGKPLRRIRSTWFEERESRKDVNQPLPEGWTRLPAPSVGQCRDEPMLYPDGCGKYVYKHRSLPDEDCDTWYYPFSVAKVDTSTPYDMPEQTRYLFCKTWKATLWSHRTIDKRFGEDMDNFTLALRKGINDPEIGVLHLHTKEQSNLWPAPQGRSNEEMGGKRELGRSVELVAINKCVHYAKTFNEEKRCYDHPLRREERITVLWVEWQNGVAYRLACGHVDQVAWKSLSPEAIDLVLG